MRQRDLILVDVLDLACSAMRHDSGVAGAWSRCLAHSRRGASQARLGVDQELAGHHDFLARFQPLADFGLPTGLDADLDVHRGELAVALRNDDDSALACLDHRFGGHQQRFLARRRREVDRGEHAGLQLTPGIGELDARLERARCRVHLRKNGAHLSFEHVAGQRRRAGFNEVADPHFARLVFTHLSVDPDGAEAVDAKERRSRHHRHALARTQFRDDSSDRRSYCEVRTHFAGGFNHPDLRLAHPGQAHALTRAVDQSLEPRAGHAPRG